jgi:hypothetical protein
MLSACANVILVLSNASSRSVGRSSTCKILFNEVDLHYLHEIFDVVLVVHCYILRP